VKISSSKDLEALSRAAKLGLTSWVGDQKVRIVGVVPKQLNECVAAESPVSIAMSLSSDENVGGFAPQRAMCQSVSMSNGIYSVGSAIQRHQPGYTMVSAAEPNLHSYALSTTYDGHYKNIATYTSSQLWMTSKLQSPLVSGHCLVRGSLRATADTEISVRDCRSESINSMVKPCDSTVCSSLLPRIVHYLGTVAISSRNVTAKSAVEDLGMGFHSKCVTEATVTSAVKRYTECTEENKLSNGKQLTSSTIGCIRNDHIQAAGKTHNQSVTQSQTSLLISPRSLKRPLLEDNTRVVSPKRMAHATLCSVDDVEADKYLHAKNSGTHWQAAPANNVLNHVAARLGNCDEYRGRADYTTLNCQSTVEVNNNCNSQQKSLSNFTTELKLPSGSGMLVLILYCFVTPRQNTACQHTGCMSHKYWLANSPCWLI